MSGTNFEDMLKELRIEYVASIPQKIIDVETHFKNNQRDLLRDDFHKMKGTGKTYGIAEISELGELIEKLCLKPEVATTLFIPTATDLLNKIFQSRKLSHPYLLTQDPQFQKLKEL